MDKQEFWDALIEPAKKDCTNCDTGWLCNHIVPDCMNEFDGTRPKHWIWNGEDSLL